MPTTILVPIKLTEFARRAIAYSVRETGVSARDTDPATNNEVIAYVQSLAGDAIEVLEEDLEEMEEDDK